MTYTYQYLQASPCSNLSIYTKQGNTVRMLITERDKSVGVGKSLGAGGFDEVKDALGEAEEKIETLKGKAASEGKPLDAAFRLQFQSLWEEFGRAGEMIDGVQETYREMFEELGEEMKTILPYEDFKARVQYLWDGMVPTPKYPLVEKVVMRAIEVSEAEMDALMALPSTTEQRGKYIEEFTLNDERGAAPTDFASKSKYFAEFKYRHEVTAAAMLLGRLETQAKSRAPSTGPGW